jgi:hypothetical protein
VKLSRKAALKDQAEGGAASPDGNGAGGGPQQQHDRAEQQPVH